MVRRTGPPVEEIPQLKALGLQAVQTTGSGNCLFHALSDQLYGDMSHESELRNATIDYMAANPDKFKNFVDVHSVGGTRRISKRKIPGAISKFDNTKPTKEERDKAFERYLKLKFEGGSYGDNAEIIAFAWRFNVNIKAFSQAFNYFMSFPAEKIPDSDHPFLYIVHHPYEHYSSIRNIDGPLTGLPQIKEQVPSEAAQQELREELAKGPSIQPWMVDLACEALPYETNREIVENTLKECRGNINLAVSVLFPDSSPELSGRSSSVERDPDSDDEKGQKPTKKQDRRQSRPHPLRNNLTVPSRKPDQISPDPRSLAAALTKLNDEKKSYDPDETEEEDWQNEALYRDSESASGSTSASDYSTSEQPTKAGTTRFRLTQPKKPDSEKQPGSSSSSDKSNSQEIEAKGKKVQGRVFAKPRRRLITGNERAAYLAKKSARNQHMVNQANTKTQEVQTPVLDQGIQSIKI